MKKAALAAAIIFISAATAVRADTKQKTTQPASENIIKKYASMNFSKIRKEFAPAIITLSRHIEGKRKYISKTWKAVHTLEIDKKNRAHVKLNALMGDDKRELFYDNMKFFKLDKNKKLYRIPSHSAYMHQMELPVTDFFRTTLNLIQKSGKNIKQNTAGNTISMSGSFENTKWKLSLCLDPEKKEKVTSGTIEIEKNKDENTDKMTIELSIKTQEPDFSVYIPSEENNLTTTEN